MRRVQFYQAVTKILCQSFALSSWQSGWFTASLFALLCASFSSSPFLWPAGRAACGCCFLSRVLLWSSFTPVMAVHGSHAARRVRGGGLLSTLSPCQAHNGLPSGPKSPAASPQFGKPGRCSIAFLPGFFSSSGSQRQPPAVALSCGVGAASPSCPGTFAQKPLALPARGVYPRG